MSTLLLMKNMLERKQVRFNIMCLYFVAMELNYAPAISGY